MISEGAILLGLVGIIVGGGALGLTSLAIHTQMVEEVNRKLPESQRFGNAWWAPPKTIRLFSEYRRLCPGGPLLRRQLIIIGVALLLCAIGVGYALIRLGATSH